MRTKTPLLLLSFFILFSCNLASVYSKFDAMPEDRRWFPNATIHYEFTIEDTNPNYDVLFKFSHVYDYQLATVPLVFTVESPNGEKETMNINLAINDPSGKPLGDCSGDICDLEYTLKTNTKLQKGNYKITVSTSTKLPYLPNVIGVGLEVHRQNK